MWIFILTLVTLCLFVLPLLPGFIELIRPTDVTPLRVSQDYDSNPYYFADGFRRFLSSNFEDLHSSQNHNGRLKNDARYQLVGEKGTPDLDTSGLVSKLLLSVHSLLLPADRVYEAEVYARQSITGGERSHFRAVLSDDMLHLKDHSSVQRWAHSDGEMMVGKHARLYGRATSHSSIVLSEGVEFERLHAPRIVTAAPYTPPQEVAPFTLEVLDELPDVKIHSSRRWLLNGHLDFPARHEFTGNIITGTTARIGDFARIHGNIKINAHDDVDYHLHKAGVTDRRKENAKKTACGELGDHVHIDGSLISSHDLFIGKNCRIFGPVIAENLLVIGAGTVIGGPDHPTTVTAPRIIIEGGCTIHGTIWASQGGIVRDYEEGEETEAA